MSITSTPQIDTFLAGFCRFATTELDFFLNHDNRLRRGFDCDVNYCHGR